MDSNIYRTLAQRLDSLPNGFPPTPDGVELQLLAHIFTPEEAALAARLRLSLESPEQMALRLGGDPKELREQLKGMARRGLIAAGRMDDGLGYRLMPFVVGIYEMQINRLDAEMAHLFEAYYRQAFGQVLGVQPSVHRVIPIGESVRIGDGDPPLRERRRDRGGCRGVGRAGLHLPQAEGADRRGLLAPAGCVPGAAPPARRLRPGSRRARPESRRSARDAAARRQRRAGALDHQYPGRRHLYLQLLHLLVRHPARHRRAGHRQRCGPLGIHQPGG